MKRGDIVLVVAPGDYGKPCPALVVQSDRFTATHASVAVCPLTTTILAAPIFRIAIEADAGTGLREKSQIMVDKIIALPRTRLRDVVGAADRAVMRRVDVALATFLGIADGA